MDNTTSVAALFARGTHAAVRIGTWRRPYPAALTIPGNEVAGAYPALVDGAVRIDLTGGEALAPATAQQLLNQLASIEAIWPPDALHRSDDTVHVPISAPATSTPDAAVWPIADGVWLRHVGANTIGFKFATDGSGAVVPRVVQLDAEEAWQLAIAIASALHLSAEAARRAEAASCELRRELAGSGGDYEDQWILMGEICGSIRAPLVEEGEGWVTGVTVSEDYVQLCHDGPLRLCFTGDGLLDSDVDRLVELLAAMPGVVPADAPSGDLYGYVDVPALLPDRAYDGLQWRINDHLWFHGGVGAFFASGVPRDDCGWHTVALTCEQAWLIVRAAQTDKAWRRQCIGWMSREVAVRRRRLAALLAQVG